MIRRPPRSTRTDTLFPYTTLFRSDGAVEAALRGRLHDQAQVTAAQRVERGERAAAALFNLRLRVRGVAHVHGQRHLLHEVAVLEEGGGYRARAVVQRHDVEARLALGQAIGGDALRAHRVVAAEVGAFEQAFNHVLDRTSVVEGKDASV